ncbi:DUF6644 family protein [Sphingomonas sp. M1-B02]|uniref:DUF6644 family protein n=1 Tax=Sphingomonas sp. M1-B02 TaxID=3114300 RepID=UPI00223F145B|nr:DUF6644 family protein [Sphingomonas sp. S6-11]UZK66080.1 hypothetical protein OKW87_16475 [Sphingomonas sp. S6-11]
MEAALLGLAGRLDSTGLNAWASGSAWAYPLANSIHLLGLVMLVGGIAVVDLRLAGLWTRLPARELSRALTPVAIAGLAILVASGTILFAADATALASSATFHRKLVLIGLALANAALFRWLWKRGAMPAALVRALAVSSLLLWLAVGTLGRLIAYS